METVDIMLSLVKITVWLALGGLALGAIYVVLMTALCSLLREPLADFIKIRAGARYQKMGLRGFDKIFAEDHNKIHVQAYPLKLLDTVLEKDPLLSEIVKFRMALEERVAYKKKAKERPYASASDEELTALLQSVAAQYAAELREKSK